MINRISFYWNRVRERLWVRPLAFIALSIAAVFLAKLSDNTTLGQLVPEIDPKSIETLLTVISASMLVISTFAVASMVSAYAAASGSATPRSFSLIVSDDVSQLALSAFMGAFIFSIVALVVLKNGYYARAGNFALFVLTIIVFAVVILTFLRWVDRIARLGRLGTTIDKVEEATADALEQRRLAPTLGGAPVPAHQDAGQAVYGESIGYVQRIDMISLQAYAAENGVRITVDALPGTFAAPGHPLAYVRADEGKSSALEMDEIVKAFKIGDDRIFDEDPRFGLIVLAEIAGRALSPGINDPGTAIDTIGTFVRLFAKWVKPVAAEHQQEVKYDRVEVPEISMRDMFDDAFTAIGRDGAGAIEVASRLQKGLESLTLLGNAALREAALYHARMALARSEKALDLPEDVAVLRRIARFATTA